jgi:hypothetical protein
MNQFEEQGEAPSFYDSQDSNWEDVLDRDTDNNDPVSEILQSMLQSWSSPNVNVTVQSSTQAIDSPRQAESATMDNGSQTEIFTRNFDEDSDTDSENDTSNNTGQGQDTVRIMQLMK